MAILDVSVEQRENWQIFKLVGSLTEGIEEQLIAYGSSAGRNCTFDCQGITSINSSGIAEWLNFRKSFDPGRVIIMRHCSTVVVDAMNMIVSFSDHTVVHSVMLPLACIKCGKEESEIFEISPGMKVTEFSRPQTTCAHCNGEMTLQIDPEEYLSFLTTK